MTKFSILQSEQYEGGLDRMSTVCGNNVIS
jgi:hypothetical protein